MAQDIQVAVVGQELEELMFRPVPPIDDFLDKIFVVVQLEPKWSFVSFATGVALNVEHHSLEQNGPSL